MVDPNEPRSVEDVKASNDCQRCGGDGYEAEYGRVCVHCGGTGYEPPRRDATVRVTGVEGKLS